MTVIAGVLTGLVLILPFGASAATVTNTNDSGPGSLRQAITEAVGGETIAIPAGTYELASVLTVNKSLTFNGAGARSTILDGGGATQILSIAAPAAQVTITGVTLRNGKSTGGGALSSSVPLTLTDSAILGNTSTGAGGGVAIQAAFTMERDLFAGNTATNSGGAIEFAPPTPVVGTIADSTLTQNSSGSISGAVNEQNSSTETLHLVNDSFVGNAATSEGGAFRAWSGTHIDYRNTLFARNTAASGPNCEWGGGAVVISLGYNAQDVNDPECLMNKPTDMNTVIPELGPLQNNGGPTDTLLPAATSPLIGAGDPANCTGSDQRGVPRLQEGGCDIGATESTVPTAAGLQVSNVATTSADVSGVAGTIDLGGSASFEYGTTPAFGSSASLGLSAGLLTQNVATTIGGLAPGTTYHIRLVVATPDGSAATAGATFTTRASTPAPLSPAPPPAACRVPKLRLLSLAKAKKALTNAHCALGTVTRPKGRHLSRKQKRKLVVVFQSPAAPATLKAGAKVKVKLGFPPKHRSKHAH
jgi:hypothetical protein